MNAAEFNVAYRIGTPVLAYPGARPEDIPSATRLVTRTRSLAQVLGGHTDVVWVDGHDSCIALDHVDVIGEGDLKALQLADAVAEMGALPMPVGPEAVSGAGAMVCPVNPPGHDWQNGLSCRWCSATRTAEQAIVSGLASRRGGDEESARRLLATFRADVLAEVAE